MISSVSHFRFFENIFFHFFSQLSAHLHFMVLLTLTNEDVYIKPRRDEQSSLLFNGTLAYSIPHLSRSSFLAGLFRRVAKATSPALEAFTEPV